MTTAVDRVAVAILDGFTPGDPDYPIVSTHPGPIDPPTRPLVVILSSSIDPPSIACPTGRAYTVAVWVVSPITAGDAADALVDSLVDRVLDALDRHGLVWSECRRGVFLETLPAYTLTVEVPS